MSTWAKVCQALGPAFEPYLQFVMPPLLKSAAVKADVSVIDHDRPVTEREGWEVIETQGQRIEIRTASLEEKCTAFDVLLVYSHTMGRSFTPYLSQTLNLAVPALRFFFHDGVREAAAMVIPVLVACAQGSDMMNEAFLTGVFSPLIRGITSEMDAGFLTSLYKCFGDCLRTVGGRSALPPSLEEGFLKATQNQLHTLAQKRKARADRIHGRDWEEEKEDVMLMEEMEGYALDEMQIALETLDPRHSLLIAVGSIKSMRLSAEYDSDSNDDGNQEDG